MVLSIYTQVTTYINHRSRGIMIKHVKKAINNALRNRSLTKKWPFLNIFNVYYYTSCYVYATILIRWILWIQCKNRVSLYQNKHFELRRIYSSFHTTSWQMFITELQLTTGIAIEHRKVWYISKNKACLFVYNSA